MSILKNAIDSIAIGLEDYESPDERRIISSTRNIFAGILLLFKLIFDSFDVLFRHFSVQRPDFPTCDQILA